MIIDRKKFVMGMLLILLLTAFAAYFFVIPTLDPVINKISCAGPDALSPGGCSTAFTFRATALVAVFALVVALWWEHCRIK